MGKCMDFRFLVTQGQAMAEANAIEGKPEGLQVQWHETAEKFEAN